jgi:type IV pilus assembly protein PilE
MNDRRIPQTRSRGFTLIELMITVAVIAILASIALPAYNDSVRKGRRGQAKADLVELAQTLERHYTVNGRYDANRNGSAYTLPITQSPKTGTAYYNIAASTRTQTAFTLTATPTGAQTSDSCGTLTIDQAGAKTPTTSGCF